MSRLGEYLVKPSESGEVDRGFGRALGVVGEEQVADRFGRVVVEFGDVGGVGVESECDGGVAEAGADDLGVDAGAQRHGGVGVPDVVKPNMP